MDDELMDLFAALGSALPAAAAVQTKLDRAQSALSKALLTDEVFRAREVLEEIGGKINALLAARKPS